MQGIGYGYFKAVMLFFARFVICVDVGIAVWMDGTEVRRGARPDYGCLGDGGVFGGARRRYERSCTFRFVTLLLQTFDWRCGNNDCTNVPRLQREAVDRAAWRGNAAAVAYLMD